MISLDINKIQNNISQTCSADLLAGHIGGAAVLIKQNGKTIYKDFFGSAGEGREINEKTLFRLASMTKPITAVAVLKEIGKGKLSLDSTVDEFIPEYVEMTVGDLDENGEVIVVGQAKSKITVRHLLTHTSGIGSGKLCSKEDKLTVGAQTDLKSITDAYAKLPLSFEPYTAQAYSATVGFDILARIVEIVSGKSYDRYLKEEIFEPLGMVDTTFAPTEEQWERMTLMHSYKDGISSFAPLNKSTIFGGYPLTYFCGGAGLASTLSDYEKFVDMLASRGKTENGDQLIPKELIDLMATPWEPFGISPSQRWGLSVRVITTDTNRIPKGSFGWSGAYGCHFWVDPTNNITAIYMKNSTFDGGSNAKTAADLEKNVYLSI